MPGRQAPVVTLPSTREVRRGGCVGRPALVRAWWYPNGRSMRASPGARWRHVDGRSPLPIRLRSVSPAVAWQGGVMGDRVREMFELCSSVLFDIDDAGRLLIGNDESGSMQLRCYDVGTRTWAVLLDAEG